VLVITINDEGAPYYCDDDSDGYMDSTSDGTYTANGCMPSGCQAEPGNDCDDSDPDVSFGENIWYADTDSDNYGDPDNSMPACNQPDGYVSDNTDCNDSDAAMNPGAAEICDGVDNDCDAGTGDGRGEGWFGGSCDGPDADLCEEGMYECINGMQSCSDINGDIGEICSDGIDNDCDGTVDEPNTPESLVVSLYPVADTSVNSGSPSSNYGTDLTLQVDGSPTKITYLRYGVTGLTGTVQSARLSFECVNNGSAGGTIHAISDNSWDENTVTFDTRPVVDGAILDTVGAVAVGDIVEFDVTPAVGGNGVYSFAIVPDSTNRVEYRSREDSTNQPVLVITINDEGAPYYCDDDFDGYMDSTSDGTYTANGCIPAGCQAEPGNDCDDSDPGTNGLSIWYADTDSDTYGDAINSLLACSQPDGYVTDNTDCNDSDSAMNPGAVEVCDGIDNDCNGLMDDSDPGVTGQSIWYADTDSDTYGEANNSLQACNQPDGYVTDNTDCNDSDPGINPGEVEVCDGIDNDCDGLMDGSDPGTTGQSIWYADTDSDAYGDANNSMQVCNQPDGYVTDSADCDDSDSAINPGAVEVCDGIDNDCDGLMDDGDPGVTGQSIWYADADSDTYGDADNSALACNQPDGYVTDSADCNDSDSAINSGAVEVCDGIDNDCDAGTGDGSGEGWFGGSCDGSDADLCEEGMYECINGMQSCTDITGDIGEICSDGMDNDCDGMVDESNVSGGTVVSVYPVADATVDSNDPSGNYGSSSRLEVDGTPTRVAYLRFDVTDIDRAVQSVRLRLTVGDASSSGGTIHAISDNSWDENTVTFDTRPVVDGAALDTVGAVAVDDTIEFDITGTINQNGIYSFAINSESSNGVDYYSRENTANQPELIITIDEEGVPYYCDDDSDGYMDSTSNGTYTTNGCIPAGCQTEPGNDCDDSDPGITGQSIWYTDTDSDTYGDANNSALACSQPDGYVTDNTDCNDSDPGINPGAVEVCDGIDNDCDGLMDDSDPGATGQSIWFADTDSDTQTILTAMTVILQ
jgi:hypothetical protein